MKRPPFTPKQRLDTFKAYGAIVLCQADGCDSAIYISEAELDHHVALIDGGKHELDNWRPVCSSCHRRKSAREHKNNAKSKRLNAARQAHAAIVKREAAKQAGKIKSRGFETKYRKKMNGSVEKRT